MDREQTANLKRSPCWIPFINLSLCLSKLVYWHFIGKMVVTLARSLPDENATQYTNFALWSS